jgi:acyl-CoA synthetase (AMP-forming)/AMP-acid ligase II
MSNIGVRWPDVPTHATDGLPAVGHSAWLLAWISERAMPAAENEIAFLQFTSGSTGDPKGVMIGTRQALLNVRAVWLCSSDAMLSGWEELCARDGLAVVNWVPQYHDMGLIGNIMLPAMLGMRGELLSPVSFLQRPACWLEAMTRLSHSHSVISSAPDFAFALVVRKTNEAARAKLVSTWSLKVPGAFMPALTCA